MSQLFYSGVVEDRMDPLELGRCKVRVVGVHTEDLVSLPTTDLPWAFPLMPITSASVSGIGDAPVGPVEGSWVIVFFRDGADMQQPVFVGTLVGIPDRVSTGKAFTDPNKKYPIKNLINEPDTNRLARGEQIDNTIVKVKEDERQTNMPIGRAEGATWSQPYIPYNAKYPYNHVWQSESGNFFEHDDTPKAERTHHYHRSGTFTEVDANGTQVNRIVGNGYEIIDKDGYVYIKGQCVINVDGSATVKVGGDAHVDVVGKVNISAKDNVNIGSEKSITLQAKDSIQFICKDLINTVETYSANVKYAVNVLAGKNVNIHGAKGYWQSNTAVPKEPNLETWSNFKSSDLERLPDAPSRTMDTFVGVEGMTPSQMLSVGENPNDPKFAGPVDPATGQAAQPASIVSVGQSGATVKAPTATLDPNCQFSNDHKLSASLTIGDMLFPESGGKVVAQHGLTACNIVQNMSRVANNVLEPLRNKYGKALNITSGFRKAGNKYSLPEPSVSKHEKGLACDFQFTDCKTHNDYMNRVAEMKAYIAYDKLLVENRGGSIWIHVQFNS